MYGGSSWGNYHKSSIYAAGQYNFLSIDLAHYISNMMTHEQRMSLTDKRPSEDMDIGAFVFSHPNPIKFVTITPPYKFWYHPLKTAESWNEFWEERIDELPKRGDHLPFNFLCPRWAEKNYF